MISSTHQGYLISRGVRALALIGTVDANGDKMLRAYNKLQFMEFGTECGREPIPAVMERRDAERGAGRWVRGAFMGGGFDTK